MLRFTQRLLFCLAVLHATRVLEARTVSAFSPWSGRSLLNAFSSLHGGCPQGPQQENSQATMLNHHDWWEKHWGRSGASWPRRGTQDCWQNRGDVCKLPNQDHVVCLPGSRRGSTMSRGWALDPKSQACKPGVHCLYACEPGYYWTQFNQQETSNFDSANAQQKGNCDGSWDYGTSTHGVYCKPDGTLQMPSEPLCKMGETFVYAENRLDKHVFLCQTVFPGHEIFLIPTLVKPGETVMITTQPMAFWHGPTFQKPPHGDIYVSFAGADIMEACTWDEFSPSGAALLPYEIGSGVEDTGAIYSTHYFYQQPNSEVPSSMVGYTMDLECESSDPGVCGNRVAHNNVITLVTRKKPPRGSKVKFVFKPAGQASGTDYVYREPNKPHMPDPMMITGLKKNAQGRSTRQTRKSFKPPTSPAPTRPAPAAPTSQTQTQSSEQTHTQQTQQHQQHTFGSTTVTRSGAQQQHTTQYTYHPSPGTYYGRKLLGSQAVVTAFIENTLDEPIMACDGLYGSGMSVGPGEIVRLPSEGRYFVGLKGDAWFACQDASKIAWEIDLSQEKQEYSYVLHPERNMDRPLQYSLQLKCTSDDDACVVQSVNSIRVSATSDGATTIVFRVQPLMTARTSKQANTYKWGNSLVDFISSMFAS